MGIALIAHIVVQTRAWGPSGEAVKKKTPSFRPNVKFSNLVYQGGRSQHYDLADSTYATPSASEPPTENRLPIPPPRGKDGRTSPHEPQ